MCLYKILMYISMYISIFFVNFVYFVLRKLLVAEVVAGEAVGVQCRKHIREVAAAEGPTVKSSLALRWALSLSLLASVVLRGRMAILIVLEEQAVFPNSALFLLPTVESVEPLVSVGALVAQGALPILQALIFRSLEMVALLAHITRYVLLEEKVEHRFLVVVVPQLALPNHLQLLEASTGEAVLVVLEAVTATVLPPKEPLEQAVSSLSPSFLRDR
jgi:hypothetical protein